MYVLYIKESGWPVNTFSTAEEKEKNNNVHKRPLALSPEERKPLHLNMDTFYGPFSVNSH